LLLATVQRGRKLDLQFLQLEHAAFRFGVNPTYGNISFAGRKKKEIVRQKAKSVREALKARAVESSVTRASLLIISRSFRSFQLDIFILI